MCCIILYGFTMEKLSYLYNLAMISILFLYHFTNKALFGTLNQANSKTHEDERV